MSRSDAVNHTWSLFSALFFAGACQASVTTQLKSGADRKANPEDPFSELEGAPLEQADAMQASSSDNHELELESHHLALLGARHDVHLKADQPATCRCLAVVAGFATDERLTWESLTPSLDTSRQLVVAFSSRGVNCDVEGHETDAAYKGYVVSGKDVVVMVEAARSGRPAITGAVIPRPAQEGRLLIRASPAKLPFGQALAPSESVCEITEMPAVPGVSGSFALTADREEASAETSSAHLAPNITGDFDGQEEDPEDETNPEDFSEYGQPLRSRRDSVYFSLLGGFGYSTQSFGPALGLQEGTMSSWPISFHLLLGGSPLPNLAVGAILGGASGAAPSVEYGALNDPAADQLPGVDVDGSTLSFSDSNLNLLQLGVFADYYFIDEENLHGMVDVSYVSLFFSGSSALDDKASGPGLGVGIGYDFWLSKNWSAGLLARFLYAPLSSGTTEWSSTLLYPSLAATLTFQ